MNSSEYYKKLGLKCGIEIHRQLDTGKLFCRCSSAMQDEPIGENNCQKDERCVASFF